MRNKKLIYLNKIGKCKKFIFIYIMYKYKWLQYQLFNCNIKMYFCEINVCNIEIIFI